MQATAKSFTMTFSVTVKADAVPANELIRCWLPYPRTDENVKPIYVY
ncbi:MAG: hypothetical protein H6543_03860 [Prevotellaceae bacterium]|nr:hypothetical protein [Prevotellaceae bacterium]